MQISYRQKLFFSFFLVFTLFTSGIIVFEHARERRYRTEALEEKLDIFADIIHNTLIHSNVINGNQTLDSLTILFPENIRLTLVDRQGCVLYDNAIKETSRMENHARRAEIVAASKDGKGSDIRTSISNDVEYLYYAKLFNDYYVRVALPHDVQIRNFVKPDNLFLYFIIVLFVFMLAIVNLITARFGQSIKQLRDFAFKTENVAQLSTFDVQFPNDELGEIGTKIAEGYRKLKEGEKAITLEREKLLQHVYSSEEGLCFFSTDNAVEFYNGLFIQYLNTITDASDSNPANVLTDKSFEKVSVFLKNRQFDSYFETQIDKHGKTFAVRINIFDDNSFEVIINDVTKHARTQRLKQEMTGNITHELRTPVTGIRGCLETILEHTLPPEKKDYFIRSAYNQALSLSDIISDLSLITRIEEAPHTFKPEDVIVAVLLKNLKNELEIFLNEKNIRLGWDFDNSVIVKGNRNLVYSIFRNLTDNAIRYAGNNIDIIIAKYNEDKDFYYFSYADTGVGISDEQHLNRIFERFYRIGEGRTRETGGSGLGLSIVKNAVTFHKGNIVAKNRAGGGMEFLFKLPKATHTNE